MGKTRSFLFIVLCTIIPCKDAQAFHEIASHESGTVSTGYIDRFESPGDAAVGHAVWLYTKADCDSIQWTLGDQQHSENLSCGMSMGFFNVPAGIHHTVIEGCGHRIAAYLSINGDMHLMIEPSDLSSTNRCPGEERSGEHDSYYVDFLESIPPASLVSGL